MRYSLDINKGTEMIDLTEATKDWEVSGVWKIAPAGLSWIKENSYLRCGDGVTIGNRATIANRVKLGHKATIGDDVWLGDGVTIGNFAKIGVGAMIGIMVTIGTMSKIGNGVNIGDGATIGSRAKDVIDLGCVDDYRKCIAQVNGVAYIGAGCRWFTLAAALKHWANKPDRVLTMCLMQSAIYIAGYKGWAHE